MGEEKIAGLSAFIFFQINFQAGESSALNNFSYAICNLTYRLPRPLPLINKPQPQFYGSLYSFS